VPSASPLAVCFGRTSTLEEDPGSVEADSHARRQTRRPYHFPFSSSALRVLDEKKGLKTGWRRRA